MFFGSYLTVVGQVVRVGVWASLSIPYLMAGVSGKGHCAVELTVTYPGGLPASTEVELLDSTGKLVARRETWEGKASFCDFGFGEHTITVGGERCGSVTIRHVRVRPVSQHFEVVLNRCAERPAYGFPPACLLYLRVSSSDGPQIKAKVKVKVKVLNDSLELETDDYGHLWIGILEGTTQQYLVDAEGHNPERISILCKNQQSIERGVVLLPISP